MSKSIVAVPTPRTLARALTPIVRGCLPVLILSLAVPLLRAQSADPQIPPGTPDDVRQLILALDSKESEERIRAATELGNLGAAAEPAIPFLIPLLRHHGLEMVKVGGRGIMSFDLSAKAAATALAKIGKAAIPPLNTALQEPGAEELAVRWRATALARMNNPAALDILLKVVADPAFPERAAVAEALGESSDSRALERLLTLAKEDDPKLRKGALSGLRGFKDPRAADAFVAALRDPEEKVRQAAAGGLNNAADPRTLDAAIAALKDSNATVRNLCAQALGAIGDPAAIGPLVEIVASDPDKLVRFQAGRALGELTGRDFGEDGAQWQEWWEQNRQQ